MTELKILICDDDPALQGLLQRRLEKMGITPDVAGDGRESLNLVEQHDYDVIVTDIYMPEATGLEVLQFAKQKDSDTQVVIITSSATLDNAIDSLNHGAFGYLTKPFDHLIVFDNMVSRAIEYRHLLVAEKRKAEAQKRRGDMLEEEVTERVQQLQKKQKGLLALLGSLPDGILVVEENGQVVLSSPVGERWLERDRQSPDQPIHAFISQVHAEMAESTANVMLGDYELQLMAVDFPNEGEARRRAVIVRETEDDSIGAGSLVTETVMGIKKGLATLYEHGVGTEVVLNLANQFAVLEQLSGWATGTGKLTKRKASRTSTPPAPPAQTLEPAPDRASEPEPPVELQPAEDDFPQMAEDLQPTEVKSVPPFAIPRERAPTGELDGPRMTTGELADVLRATSSTPAAQSEAPLPPNGDSISEIAMAEHASETEAQSEPDPVEPEFQEQALAKPAANPDPQTESPAAQEQPAVSQVAGQDPLPSEPEESETEQVMAGPVEPDPGEPPVAEPEEVPPSDPAPKKSGLIARMMGLRADSVAGEPAHTEASGDELAGPGDRAPDDSSLYSPRVIPEEMSAKLESPAEHPANGNRGPLKIQTELADTQIFRKVLAGLSGSKVEGMGGEDSDPSRIGAEADEAPAEQPAAQAPPAPAAEPSPEAGTELAPDQGEAEPQRMAMRPGMWPPKKPSEDEKWDDTLDLSD